MTAIRGPGAWATLGIARRQVRWLSADPANRYATADEFAHALDQVIKQAVGVNTAAMLGAAVAEARAQLKVAERDADDLPTTEHRTDEHAAVGPEPELELEAILPDGRVTLAGLHRIQRFGAELPLRSPSRHAPADDAAARRGLTAY